MAFAALSGRVPLVHGEDIRTYEDRFAEAAGTQHAYSFASGRMALYVILEALGIGTGDEVIVPAFTCVVVPNAILYRGGRPIYVDIDAHTYNIDAAKIEQKITAKTKAIIAQHTFGLVCDIEPIREIANRHGLAVIEDCAHALGSTHRGRKAGSLGDVAYFSTDHSKVISTSTGGMVTTNNTMIAGQLAKLQAAMPFLSESRIRRILLRFVLEHVLFSPRICSLGTYIDGFLSGWRLGAYFDDELSLAKPSHYPYPARLSNAQARIGLSQLELLADNLAWRRKLAHLYDSEVGALNSDLQKDSSNHAFLRYTILVENRAAWTKHFGNVLDMGVWFTSIAHGRDERLDEIGYQAGSCPRAEQAARHCVNLPTHPRIKRPELLLDLLRATRDLEPLKLMLPGEYVAASTVEKHRHAATR